MIIPSNIIINADDFGLNHTVNMAVTKCFLLNLINSTSIMTNSDGFKEAVKLCKENGFQDKIGVHVNLTSGNSLTDLSGTDFVNFKGEFIEKNVNKKYMRLSSNTKKLIQKEIEAQIDELKSCEITPSHINTHHHIHTLPSLSMIFLRVAKKFNIKIRLAQTWNKQEFALKNYYRNFLNKIYSYNDLNFTKEFHQVNTYSERIINNIKLKGATEIMVHPNLNENGQIYDSYDGSFLEVELGKLGQLWKERIYR